MKWLVDILAIAAILAICYMFTVGVFVAFG